jgi:hypothetical protein
VHAKAGVAPWFVQLKGQNASALIVSANLNRRNLTKSQQAIALVMIYPEGKRGFKKLDISRTE